MKILIAEDSLTQATLMKLALQRQGYEVVLARDGIDAIRKTYQERPDLVVTDVIMPRVNGYQVCRLLRDDPKTAHIPVVLLTSLDQRQDEFWGLKSGANKFITKGGDIPSLVEGIHGFIAAHPQTGPARGSDVRAGESGSDDLDAVVMERVIHLLDRNLFESTVVSEIQNLVNSMDDFHKTMLGVLEILKKVIEFHVGAIYLGGEETQGLFILVNKPVGQEFLDRLSEQLLREAAEPPTAATPEEMEICDPQGFLGQSGRYPELPGSVLITRLATKGQTSGSIALAAAEENLYPDRVEKTFEMIVRQANIVIDYARLYERNKRLSITDGLTKLYNHRFFQEALKREFARSLRNKGPLALIMLDIDHFKSFNDTYGHQQGDVVLQELGRILKAQVRSLDIVARYGGEEFAIIMPDAAVEVALRVAERLRNTVESHLVPGPDGELRVTISLGVANIPHPEIANPAGLITIADRALYRAKQRGRNRVEQ